MSIAKNKTVVTPLLAHWGTIVLPLAIESICYFEAIYPEPGISDPWVPLSTVALQHYVRLCALLSGDLQRPRDQSWPIQALLTSPQLSMTTGQASRKYGPK